MIFGKYWYLKSTLMLKMCQYLQNIYTFQTLTLFKHYRFSSDSTFQSVLSMYQYFEVSTLFKYQYFFKYQVSILFKYQVSILSSIKSWYLKSINVVQVFPSIKSINTFPSRFQNLYFSSKYQYFSSFSAVQISLLFKYQYFPSIKVSIIFNNHCFSSISPFPLSLLFKYQTYQYFSSMNAFQISRVSILFKYQGYQYFLNIVSINTFQVSKLSIGLRSNSGIFIFFFLIWFWKSSGVPVWN